MIKDYKKYINIIKLVLVLLLFLSSSLFQLIPISIFNINIKTITPFQDIMITLFSNSCIVIALILLYYKDLKVKFIEFKNNFLKMMDTSFKYWFVGLIIMMASNLIINIFSPVKIANNEQAVDALINAQPFLSFILVTFFAPFIEEMIFRKSFKDVIPSKYLYILISGIVFGALHVVGNITTLYDLLYLIPYSALGISFAAICYKTDNIWASIFTHAIHNGVLTLFTIISIGMIL